MIAATDPNDPTSSRRVLARAKGNLGPPWPSLTFELTPTDNGTTSVNWTGETPLSADQLLNIPTDDQEATSALDEAADWLRHALDDGPMPRAEVIKLGKREGHTEITLKRAAKKLRVVSTPDTTKRGNPATWSLTDSGSSISDQLPMIPNQQPTDQEQHTQTGDFGSRSNVEPKPASTADTLADDHDDPAARISDHQPMIRNP